MKRVAAERMSQSVAVKINKAREKALAEQFVAGCVRGGIAPPTLEYEFWPGRKFRFDFAWPGSHVALESEGGIWSKGAHTRGGHFLSDLEKYNYAALMGWRVFRTVPGQLLSSETLAMIRQALS